MSVSIRIGGLSDYAALLAGNPSLLRLSFSEEALRLAGEPRSWTERPQNVLLLGANGFIGLHVLHRLLKDPRVGTIHCIVRDGETSKGMDRINEAARKYNLALRCSGKVVVLGGEYTRRELGLGSAEYRRLSEELDIVIHAAGATNHLYPYSYYRAESVKPLLRIMELCATRKLKRLLYMGSLISEVIRDGRDALKNDFFYCGYTRMKWINRSVLQHAHSRGFPSTVCLTPYVLGSELTSYKDPGKYYAFWQRASFYSRMKLLWRPQPGAYVPVAPADVLADVVVKSVFAEKQQAVVVPTLHFDLLDLADEYGWEVVSWNEFKKSLSTRYPHRRRFNIKKPFSSIYDKVFQSTYTAALFTSNLPEVQARATAPALLPEGYRFPEGLSPREVVIRCGKANGILSEAGVE